jgi:hypothetical protein
MNKLLRTLDATTKDLGRINTTDLSTTSLICCPTLTNTIICNVGKTLSMGENHDVELFTQKLYCRIKRLNILAML